MAYDKAQTVNLRSQLHVQRSKMHSNRLGPSGKKFLLLKTTKNARYVRSLGNKPILGAYTEAKKCAMRRKVR